MEEKELHPLHEHDEEIKPQSLVSRILYGAIAIIAILGLVYISGVYQASLYRRTSPDVVQNPVVNRLDAEIITLPLRIFVLTGDGAYGSERTQSDVESLVENASNIWKQAGIEFEIEEIINVSIRDDDFFRFLNSPQEFVRSVSGYDPDRINGFLVKSFSGVNGIAFIGSASFAVADYTTVYDFRAFAHEVGHLLGLGHIPGDRERLMFQGANGFLLTPQEIMTARENASSFQHTK